MIASTLTNLLKLKRKLNVALEGHSLLKEKREVLIMELLRNIRGFKEMEESLTEKLKEAYGTLETVWIHSGKEKLEILGKVNPEPEIKVKLRSIMGIAIPEIFIDIPSKKVQVSLNSTSQYSDEAFTKFREVLPLIVKWVEKEVLIWKLGMEIGKTQKRVNALEKVFIPQYKKEIGIIEENLEEEEREEFFRMKVLKKGGK
ncbi:MAG: V-type ATP synthase subunit D [candidate division WOR-3 bacterium]